MRCEQQLLNEEYFKMLIILCLILKVTKERYFLKNYSLRKINVLIEYDIMIFYRL